MVNFRRNRYLPTLKLRSCEETLQPERFSTVEEFFLRDWRFIGLLFLWPGHFLAARGGYGTRFSQSDPLLQVVSEAGP
jgi:hypothetical protein